MKEWTDEQDNAVSEALLLGKPDPWPEGFSDWHARRRSNELRAAMRNDETAGFIWDEVRFTVSRVLRSLDRKFVGHECREVFASRIADWLLCVPTPCERVSQLRTLCADERLQAIAAGAWKRSALQQSPATPDAPHPSFLGDAA